jgi:glycine/D-amino acid oxidase-like deaminating enzyme
LAKLSRDGSSTVNADVAVVGAGVVGASVAFHLEKLGVRRVLLLDRGQGPGEGSTGRATGGYRAQYATEINVRLSLLARAALLRFREETGVDPAYDPRGYLWLAEHSTEIAALRDALAVQRAAGLSDARMVDPDEIARLNPHVRGNFLGGAFCPSDGFVRPLEILRGYLRGRDARFSAEVVEVRRGGSGIESLRLSSGESVSAGAFVDAAGAWAAGFARLAGVELPVVPLRRQVAPTVETSALPASLPMTIWVGDGFHLRVRDGRVLLLRPTPGDPDDPFSLAVEPGFLDEMARLARQRVPALADVALDRDRAWAGLYEMSPDKHAILGRAPGCDNLWLANGSSGHGVMHAPALGLLLAEMIAGRPTSLDVRALRPSRFAEGEAIVAAHFL